VVQEGSFEGSRFVKESPQFLRFTRKGEGWTVVGRKTKGGIKLHFEDEDGPGNCID